MFVIGVKSRLSLRGKKGKDMKFYVAVFLIALSMSGCAGVPLTTEPVPSPSPMPSVSPSPSPSSVPFAVLGSDIGTSVDVAFAKRAIKLMNDAVQSGCVKRKVWTHEFKSFNSVFTPGVETASEAYQTLIRGMPYALDLHWYYKGWPSKVIGYTYNFKNDDWNGESETRIWSNTRFMGDERQYASHLTHELVHQARSGGFTHYTIFQGSFPYEIGDIMAECLAQTVTKR